MVQGFALARPQTVPGDFKVASVGQALDESTIVDPDLDDVLKPDCRRRVQRGFGRRRA